MTDTKRPRCPSAVSILEGDEPYEERQESLEALLADLLAGGDVEPVLAEILRQWEEGQQARPAPLTPIRSEGEGRTQPALDISDQLHQIMEQKMSVFSAKKVEKSKEQLQMKAAILASYSQVSRQRLTLLILKVFIQCLGSTYVNTGNWLDPDPGLHQAPDRSGSRGLKSNQEKDS